ncbi:hypothetical protein BS50DRAFT_661391 [Corynespora cassiicola Philippines]|uniref:Alcohol acetyltransferase n=1 Tax=Corynespora cassiicola Philippines TaxID=1448308 RepID=A0A2T2NVV1_CORCC|nr:hypothetical protein BS50DRAFT_661391 [Corynespora cassiicola Philippines]
MSDIRNLSKLRPLGKLEQVSAACHHLGFYNNVGLSAHYSLVKALEASDFQPLVYSALADVIVKNNILSAIPVGEETTEPYFAQLPSIHFEKCVFFVERNQSSCGSEDKELDTILENQHNTNFKSHYGTLPFWRLLIIRTPGLDTDFTASFIFHHAIGDGMAGIIFHRAFKDAIESALTASSLDKKKKLVFDSAKNSLFPPLEELHPLPICENSPSAPTEALKQWTGNPIQSPCLSRFRSLTLSPAVSKGFVGECREKTLSVTSVLPSWITTILFTLVPETTEALTCIIPVNLRPWLTLPRNVSDTAIGTFIDAFKVQLRRPRNLSEDHFDDNVWAGAQQTGNDVRQYLTGNLSPSGEPYTAVAVFKRIPDVSVVFNSTLGKDRDATLEVSNLGVFSRPHEGANGDCLHCHVGRVTFSRSSVISGSAITISVVTGGDGGLTIGFSWQKDVVEDELVNRLIDETRRSFGAYS